MATKRKTLSATLTEAVPPKASAPVKPMSDQIRPVAPQGARQANRKGKRVVSAWFPDIVALELDELRLERSRALGRKVTLQEIQAEALNDLFKKYGRAELAPVVEG
jgi:hypothetical protein